MSKEKIRALLVAPHESPRIVYIEPTMKAFRKLVDADAIEHGGIEAKKLERNVYAMFNKDRFLVASLDQNRHIPPYKLPVLYYWDVCHECDQSISIKNY